MSHIILYHIPIIKKRIIMFISPKVVVESGWIKFPKWMDQVQKDKCLQPNAIDFSVDKLFQIVPESRAFIGNDTKVMRALKPVDLTCDFLPDVIYNWKLNKGSYDAVSDFYVEIPEGVVCTIHTRSTFIRNGLFVTTGIFDSGFNGHLGCTLHNMFDDTNIQEHTRIAQIAFIKADKAGVYAGGYNTDVGKHWTSSLD
jgi:deoxycytidine triphosphate deaminase